VRLSRLVCLAIAILGLSIIGAPLVKSAADWLLRTFPGTSSLFDFDENAGIYDFGRVYRRLLLALTLLVGYFGRSWLGLIPLRKIPFDNRPARQLGSGWALGCLTFAFFLINLLLLGERSIALRVPPDWAWWVGRGLVTGLVVGAIEETIFRGVLLGSLLTAHSKVPAVLISSTLFSVVHFLRASVPVSFGASFDVGLRAFLAHAAPLADPATLSSFVGLTLLGVVLAFAYLWSRSLPFAIGLHAGWVFLGKIDGLLLRERSGIEWLYGHGGILSRPLGWALLLLILPLLRFWLSRPLTTDDTG